MHREEGVTGGSYNLLIAVTRASREWGWGWGWPGLTWPVLLSTLEDLRLSGR